MGSSGVSFKGWKKVGIPNQSTKPTLVLSRKSNRMIVKSFTWIWQSSAKSWCLYRSLKGSQQFNLKIMSQGQKCWNSQGVLTTLVTKGVRSSGQINTSRIFLCCRNRWWSNLWIQQVHLRMETLIISRLGWAIGGTLLVWIRATRTYRYL